MMEFVCIECSKERAKGCTLIVEDGKRLPLVCVNEKNRKVIACRFMEVPQKNWIKDIFPFK